MTKQTSLTIGFWLAGFFLLWGGLTWFLLHDDACLDDHPIRRIMPLSHAQYKGVVSWKDKRLPPHQREHMLHTWLLFQTHNLLYQSTGRLLPLVTNALLFSLFVAGLALIAFWLGGQWGLSPGERFFWGGILLLGSPGLLWMYARTEDDLVYAALLLLIVYLVSHSEMESSWSSQKGWWFAGSAGALLGLCWALHSLTIIYLGLSAGLVWLLWRQLWVTIARWVLVFASAFATYYLCFLSLYTWGSYDPMKVNLMRGLRLWRGADPTLRQTPVMSGKSLLFAFEGFRDFFFFEGHPMLAPWYAGNRVVWLFWVGMWVLVLPWMFWGGWRVWKQRKATFVRLEWLLLFLLLSLAQAFLFESHITERWLMFYLCLWMLWIAMWSSQSTLWKRGLFLLGGVQLFLTFSLLLPPAHPTVQKRWKTFRSIQSYVQNRPSLREKEVLVFPFEWMQYEVYLRSRFPKAWGQIFFVKATRNKTTPAKYYSGPAHWAPLWRMVTIWKPLRQWNLQSHPRWRWYNLLVSGSHWIHPEVRSLVRLSMSKKQKR
jgi:hypothetical protein